MGFMHIEKDKNIAVVWMDQPGEKVNTLSANMMEEFRQTMEELEKDKSVKGVVLISKKPDSFIVGADLNMFDSITQAGEAEDLSRQGSEFLKKIEDSSKPFIAAIHGPALGGGLEVAMACAYRIASDHPKTYMGLPEVKLGLLPGAGGTQRLPRLVGIQEALGMVLTGKNVYARKAKKIGLVDEVVQPYGLLDAAKSVALRLSMKPYLRKRKRSFMEKLLESTPFGRRMIYNGARKMVMRQTKGNYPAPLKIIDCISAGMENGIKEGFVIESVKFDELVRSPESKQLRNLFFAMNDSKKNPMADQAKKINRVGVLGAGFMGAGIADVTIEKNIPVVMKDLDRQAIARGEKAIWDRYQGKVKKRAMTNFDCDVTMSRLTPATDYKLFDKVDVVVEAVFEDLELKRKVLADTEAVVGENCIFASNTSCLPIADIATECKHPERVVGMHYFSPVHMMPLLEIVITDQTADWVTATAIELGAIQGKHMIVVKDGPGFYTTRILSPLMNEAVCLLEEGAKMEEIDKAMKQFGFPVGPIKLFDEVGIDVGAHVEQIMGKFFQSRGIKRKKNVAEKLVKAGFKGKKNQKGFYRYDKKSKGKLPNDQIYQYFGGSDRKSFPMDVIQKRVTWVFINEAARCLEEGIISNPKDGDLGAILGLGFPPFRGGPFRYMDHLGTPRSLEILQELQQKYGERFTPASIIEEYAKDKRSFYEQKSEETT